MFCSFRAGTQSNQAAPQWNQASASNTAVNVNAANANVGQNAAMWPPAPGATGNFLLCTLNILAFPPCISSFLFRLFYKSKKKLKQLCCPLHLFYLNNILLFMKAIQLFNFHWW